MKKSLWVFLILTLFSLLFQRSEAYGKTPLTTLEWESVEDSSGYEVEVKGTSLSFRQTRRVKRARLKIRLKAGKYQLRLRSLDERGVGGPWSSPMDFVSKLPTVQLSSPVSVAKKIKRLYSKEQEKSKVTFQWKPLKGIKSYEITVQSKDGKSLFKEQVYKSSATLKIDVAKNYIWSVAPMIEDEVVKISSAQNRFQLYGPRLPQPKIEEPKTKFVNELNWKKPEHVRTFSYKVQRKTARGWKTIERKKRSTKNKVPFDLSRPSGLYKLSVKAKSPLRKNSKWASQEFKVRGDIRNPASIPSLILQDSILKPTKYYAVASYLITQLNYQGSDRNNNANAIFDSTGGTGRIGMGYQSLKSPWGVLGIIDLSGFNINEENFTFASAEVLATYSFLLGITHQFKFSAGGYHKALPALSGSQTDGFEGVGELAMQGFTTGFEYWKPITKSYGIKLHSAIYYPFAGSTPNGKEMVTLISYQAGLLGSYKFTQNLMGLAGLTIRKDQGSYFSVNEKENPQSLAAEGDLDTISIEGQYLNFILEYSF